MDGVRAGEGPRAVDGRRGAGAGHRRDDDLPHRRSRGGAMTRHERRAWLVVGSLVVPPVGWLLDRVEAQLVIVTGAVLAGVGFLLASRAGGFGAMLVAHGLIGVGLGAATLLPASL